jgi:hypothetical protein
MWLCRGLHTRCGKAAGRAGRHRHFSGFHVPGQFCGSLDMPIPAAALAFTARFRAQDVSMVSDRGNCGRRCG